MTMFEGTERQGGATVSFSVAGKPIGKNFKVIRYGKGADAATGIVPTPDAVKWIKEIEKIAQVAAVQSGWVVPDLDIPVRVDLTIRVGMAQSWPRARRYRLLGDYCPNKPDTDNVENCVFDALVGHLQKQDNSPGAQGRKRQRANPILPDDSNIAETFTRSIWVTEERQGIDVRVTTLGRLATEEVFE